MMPVSAHEHHAVEEYENDQQQGGLKINARVVLPAENGHLSICINNDNFTLCRELDVHDQRVVVTEMTADTYHIAEGESFKACADLYPNNRNGDYHSCVPMQNHGDGHPEFANIALTKTCTAD